MINFLSFLMFIFGLIFLILFIKEKIQAKQNFNKRKQEEEAQINKLISAKMEKLNEEIERNKKNAEDIIREKQKQSQIYEEQINKYKEEGYAKADMEINHYKDSQFSLARQLLEKEKENKQIEITNSLNTFIKSIDEEKQAYIEELNKTKEVINNYRERQNTINEAVIRKKQLQEQENFFKIVLSKEDKEDISILKEIEPKLKNKTALNKLIWSVFIQKPTKEMIKRVLKGKEPSGIYKITRIKTGEIYIGKSTNVANRFNQHIKTALGVGTLASSTLHSIMKEDDVDGFTFELLKEVEKENLSKEESYYIDFYNTKETGLNMINGAGV